MKKTKVAFLSNNNLNFINKFFDRHFDFFQEEGFNQLQHLIVNDQSKLYEFKPQFLFLYFDFYFLYNVSFDIEGYFNQIFSAIDLYLSKNTDVMAFINHIYLDRNSISVMNDLSDDSYVITDLWYKYLNQLFIKHKNIFLFDSKKLINKLGTNKVYSYKYYQIASIPFTLDFIEILYKKAIALIHAFQVPRKKVLCIDLDNTIWGGVLGDDGPFGIKLNQTNEDKIYLEIQKKILQIKNLGVLICIVSKNSISNVLEVFEKNHNLILKINDFTIIKANWENKSQNILEISQELNLGLDSFVFLDDNDFEKNEVKKSLPEVEVILNFSPTRKDLYSDVIDAMYENFFLTFKLTDEDKNRNKQYGIVKLRNSFKNTTSSFNDYLTSLEMKIHVSIMKDYQKDRVFQLINKTNQFNLTTKRISLEEFSNLNQLDSPIFVANLKDKFSDEGLTFIMLTLLKENEVYIENIIMSCRVMGRDLELSVFSLIEKFFFQDGYRKIYGNFIPSKKNSPVKNLYDRLGFKLLKSSENLFQYEKTLDNDNFLVPLITASWV